MQTIVYHKQLNQSAQASGMPTYWSAIEINSDRTPEFTSGSMEDRVS